MTTAATALETWSRVLGSPSAAQRPEALVVVPPDSSPEPAIAIAVRLLAQGRGVRIVGRGVTTPSFQAKVSTSGSLVLTELDAYLPTDKRPAQKALAAGLARWLDEVFGDAVPGVPGRDAFWSSAVTRLGLQDVFDAWCFASGLAEAHGSSHFVLTEPNWVGGRMLAGLVRARGGQLDGPASPTTTTFDRLRIGALSGAGALVSVLARAREFVREAPTRRFLESVENEGKPRVWLGVNGGWEYSSRHVLEPLGAFARNAETKVGVLLQSSLRPGNLGDAHRRSSSDAAILPVLSSASIKGVYSRVEQVVSHSNWRQFLGAIPGTCVAMMRCSGRVATRAAEIDFGPFILPVTAAPGALVRVTTLDVLRAREAAAATRRLIQRNQLEGAHIALSQASLVADAVPDLLLQTAGATTFDVVHGALAEPLDMVSTARTSSTRKLLWTDSEARYLREQTQRECIGAVPSRTWVRQPRRAPHHPLRVLVLSNYGTLVGGGHRRRLPRLGYQEHLLANVKGLVSSANKRLELRWRPHPGDDRDQIRLAAAAFGPDLSLSQAKRLDEDLEWADLFITSLSSTVVEALAWDKPLLMHDIPIHESAVLMSLFDAQRRFRNDSELAAAFAAAATQLEEGAPLLQEEALRREFFGPTGAPHSIASLIFST